MARRKPDPKPDLMLSLLDRDGNEWHRSGGVAGEATLVRGRTNNIVFDDVDQQERLDRLYEMYGVKFGAKNLGTKRYREYGLTLADAVERFRLMDLVDRHLQELEGDRPSMSYEQVIISLLASGFDGRTLSLYRMLPELLRVSAFHNFLDLVDLGDIDGLEESVRVTAARDLAEVLLERCFEMLDLDPEEVDPELRKLQSNVLQRFFTGVGTTINRFKKVLDPPTSEKRNHLLLDGLIHLVESAEQRGEMLQRRHDATQLTSLREKMDASEATEKAQKLTSSMLPAGREPARATASDRYETSESEETFLPSMESETLAEREAREHEERAALGRLGKYPMELERSSIDRIPVGELLPPSDIEARFGKESLSDIEGAKEVAERFRRIFGDLSRPREYTHAVHGAALVYETPMPLTMPAKLRGRTKRASARGKVLRHAHRWVTDKRVFSSVLSGISGTVLFDQSGSMSLSDEELIQLMHMLPAVTVAGYVGQRLSTIDGTKYDGSIAILARNGKRCVSAHIHSYPAGIVSASPGGNRGGANSIDGAALRWLTTQAKPWIWVSDGGVSGVYPDGGGSDVFDAGISYDCFEYVARKRIVMLSSTEKVLEYSQRKVRS